MNVLVLYYSRHGSTRELAYKIAQGVEECGVEAKLRTVPEVSAMSEQSTATVPAQGDPYVSEQDLLECSGLAMGSPTRFGNMAAPMKYFLDTTTATWLKGNLVNKPACVFTASASLHGGQETTLLTMMLPLLHQGMIIVGLPYTEAELHNTTSGGSPYGVSHVANKQQGSQLTVEEQVLAIEQGRRLAKVAMKMG